MNEGSVIVNDCDGHAVAESKDDIVNETMDNSQMKNSTRSKSRKIIPDPIMPSD